MICFAARLIIDRSCCFVLYRNIIEHKVLLIRELYVFSELFYQVSSSQNTCYCPIFSYAHYLNLYAKQVNLGWPLLSHEIENAGHRLTGTGMNCAKPILPWKKLQTSQAVAKVILLPSPPLVLLLILILCLNDCNRLVNRFLCV